MFACHVVYCPSHVINPCALGSLRITYQCVCCVLWGLLLSSPNGSTPSSCYIVGGHQLNFLSAGLTSMECYFQDNVLRALCDFLCFIFFYHSIFGCSLCYLGSWYSDDTGQHTQPGYNWIRLSNASKKPTHSFNHWGGHVPRTAAWPHQFRLTIIT